MNSKIAFVFALLLGACTPPGSDNAASAPSAAPSVGVAAVPLDAKTAAREADLIAIKHALESFHAKNGAYPVTQGLRSVVTHQDNWIPGLAPDFIAKLPREAENAPDADGAQYMYASDGADYKLIVHGVPSGECGPRVERDGIRVDAVRSNEKGCWAYGFWTGKLDRL